MKGKKVKKQRWLFCNIGLILAHSSISSSSLPPLLLPSSISEHYQHTMTLFVTWKLLTSESSSIQSQFNQGIGSRHLIQLLTSNICLQRRDWNDEDAVFRPSSSFPSSHLMGHVYTHCVKLLCASKDTHVSNISVNGRVVKLWCDWTALDFFHSMCIFTPSFNLMERRIKWRDGMEGWIIYTRDTITSLTTCPNFLPPFWPLIYAPNFRTFTHSASSVCFFSFIKPD